MNERIINETKGFVRNLYPSAEAIETSDKLKFRLGGKLFLAIYFTERKHTFLIILGKEERDRFEKLKDYFPRELKKSYDSALVYNDCKWMIIPVDDMGRLWSILNVITKVTCTPV